MKSVKSLFLIAICTIFLFQACQNLGLTANDIHETSVDQQAPAVFINAGRIELIKERIQNQSEPAYSAFRELMSQEEELLEHEAQVPDTWYVPPFYQRENNWGNWGLVLVLASSAYLDDNQLFEEGVERWKYFEILNERWADDAAAEMLKQRRPTDVAHSAPLLTLTHGEPLEMDNHSEKPVGIIFDTDMTTDCDDAGALAMLHTLERKGKAQILATMVNNMGEHSAGATAAINAFYDRPDIPVGAYQGDEYSSLNGVQLVEQKVDHLVIMGGHFLSDASERYPYGNEHNFRARGSAQFTGPVLDRWPTRVLLSGYEIGENILTGPRLTELNEEHPVRRAYAGHPSEPLINGRMSWDQTAILAAVRDPELYWRLSEPGRVEVDLEGYNSWISDPEGLHVYLIERDNPAPSEIAEIIEELMVDMP